MNAGLNAHDQTQSSASSVLRSLVLCDLVDSTALVERLGDREAAELIRKHDRLARTLADRHGGQEIDKTDGFLMMFERPLNAVAFALDYQRGLRQLNAAEKSTLAARVGIHVGEVVIWDNSSEDIAKGAKPVEVEGLVKPVTSRLMNLALPGQILLSNIAYDVAHRAQGELGEALEKVRWRTHGRYRFRGVPDPVAVFEVGEEGLAPLKAPPWSSKAHREVPFWRRPATVVIEALVVVVLITVPLVMFLRPDPAIAFANRDWVVVGSLHNLTGETVFDDALESALRIGLEQSRYVNVMPDLKVRNTITRMQRDPDATEVDRAVGSEVAIRDGARALILPTIAEIGGRVRITAEVIDPQTQTTVYSETADGIGKESILSSLDAINNRLRVRLGEALATVSEESMPLEKAATSNLDALRAFSLAYKAHDLDDTAQARTLYLHAIELDPGFAQARIQLGTLYLDMNHARDAEQQFETALQSGDRLTQTDKMLAEAWLASVRSPRDALEKWKALASLEPDLFPAQGAYAYNLWMHANDFATAIEADKRNAVAQNPNNGSGYYLLGTLYLGMEDYAQAEQQFAKSKAAGTRFQDNLYAAVFVVQGKFDKALELKRAAPAPATSSAKLQDRLFQLNLALAQGQWGKVQDSLAVPVPNKAGLDATDADTLADVVTGMQVALAPATDRKAILDRAIEQLRKSTTTDDIHVRAVMDQRLLFHAWLAAYYKQTATATRLLERLGNSARSGEFPALTKGLTLVEAILDARRGDIAQAIQNLQATVDGTEYYATHLALMILHAENKDFEAARHEAAWLASHRGRAYTEAATSDAFVPFNLYQSTLAKAHQAEFSLQLEEKAAARKALAELRAAWPQQDMPRALLGWITRLEQDSHETPQK